MAGASLVTSVFGNSPAFPIDWPGLRGLQGVVPQDRRSARFRGITSRAAMEIAGGSCAFITTKGTNGADYRHHHLPHARQLAWLVRGGCPAAVDLRHVHQEQR